MTPADTQRGARLDARALLQFVRHVLERNADLERPPALCIWGGHGIGKTMIVEDLAKHAGWGFSYCAPAQFEEMGDLHGLPRHETRDGRAVTAYAPPEWVPTREGPGILLLDDINRADDRILRGLMQLLQQRGMFSWSLPPRWQIVATANPDTGDYSVTPMDEAMLTRMIHVTMTFDARAWAAWATRAGVDPRGIDFVLTYPEVVTGKRTTPRTLTQFFEQLAPIADLRAELDLVSWLAQGSLDDATVAAFIAFISDNLGRLLSPEEVLDATAWAPVGRRLGELGGAADARRVDLLATICTRVFLHLTGEHYTPGERHAANLVAFLTSEALPNDLRFALHRDLLRDGGDPVKAMMRDRRLAKLLVDGL
jgi:MoxR-like ATPase